MFKQTNFRLVKNAQKGRDARSASTIEDVSNFKQKYDLTALPDDTKVKKIGSGGLVGLGGLQSKSTVAGISSDGDSLTDGSDQGKRKSNADDGLQKKEIKHTFKPVTVNTPNDGVSNIKDEYSNLAPYKKADVTVEINLRSLIVMDNEP